MVPEKDPTDPQVLFLQWQVGVVPRGCLGDGRGVPEVRTGSDKGEGRVPEGGRTQSGGRDEGDGNRGRGRVGRVSTTPDSSGPPRPVWVSEIFQ